MKKKTDAYVFKFKTGNFPAGVTQETLDAEINKREEEILNYQKALSAGTKGGFNGVAFVSLNTERMKEELLTRYKTRGLERFRIACCGGVHKAGLMFHDQKLYLSQAAEPGDVFWENLHLNDKQAYMRKFVGVLFTLGLLILCGCVIFYLTAQESSTTTTTTTTTAVATTDNSTTTTSNDTTAATTTSTDTTSTDTTATDTTTATTTDTTATTSADTAATTSTDTAATTSTDSTATTSTDTTTNATRLLAVKSQKHFAETTDSTSTNSSTSTDTATTDTATTDTATTDTATTDTATTDTATTDTATTDSSTTTESSTDNSTTATTETAADDTTASTDSTDTTSSDDSSESTETKLLTYFLAFMIVVINKGLCFAIPHVAA